MPAVETVPLLESAGRILAVDAGADRDYPPFDRSMRDGFAVRAADLPGTVQVLGEIRAGEASNLKVAQGQAIEIMTGAPVPAGADAVVMVEHCTREGDQVRIPAGIAAGSNISAAGCEAQRGDTVVPAGVRIDHTVIAYLASAGLCDVKVYARPRVAIIATGDELVDIESKPLPHQIRNSNSYSLAAQVKRAGGIPVILPIARDTIPGTRRSIEKTLQYDLVLLSGGVSAGRFDVVEPVLAELGAEFFFDRVLIQPGAPLVFGVVQGKFFFGLPGNPASTMVTFELFARAALEVLAGRSDAPLPLALATLTRDFRHKPGLTRFLPAQVLCTEVTPVDWKGSGDVPSLTRSNAFLVANAERAAYAAGDAIPVLFK